ncbi:DUF3604 domain-containing protein [Bosea sp. LjRoot90]|uniref:DUF3604 domain-containing protein n=1 Tax=Bosea sp. LjRoot90 TaxID=3342342 RepID=UPI003ECDD5DF
MTAEAATEQVRIVVESDLPEIVAADSLICWSLNLKPAAPLPPGAAIGLARHWPSDWGSPQFDRPDAADYVTIVAAEGCPTKVEVRRQSSWHPFDHALLIELPDGLKSDLTVTFGAGGSPGHRVQTFVEDASPLSLRLRSRPDGAWHEIERLRTWVVGGPIAGLAVTVPSVVRPGERFSLHILAEDCWGNPASGADLELRVPELGLSGRLTSASGSVTRIEATLPASGVYRLAVEDEAGRWRALSNPIRCDAAPAHRLYWGDIHAQSAIGCGAQSIAGYFRFGRDVAALDFASHQGNCFLVSNPEWTESREVTRQFNEDGRFVALLGYEWSGTTSVGGDHNVYFPGDDGELRRCSHRHLTDVSDVATDLPHVTDLHDHVRGRDLLMQVHVGGRTSNLDWHEPSTERLIEVHSTHATSEWFLHDALSRGWKFGVTGGSDGIDGRPGRSRPGRMSVRNLGGGLAALAAPDLSRASVWSQLAARRTYATTGPRILLAFSCEQAGFGESLRTKTAPSFELDVAGTAPLRSVQVFRGITPVFHAPIQARDPRPSDVLRVAWRGASGFGNWERARMIWDGSLAIQGATIRGVRPYAMDTAAEGVTGWSSQNVSWTSITAGDWDGIELDLDRTGPVSLRFESGPMAHVFSAAEIEAGASHRLTGPNRELRAEWLPGSPASEDWSGTWTETENPAGEQAYWLRVEQDDGALAWSSPIYVTVSP